MTEILIRTNKTELSDDELIIFDVLFDGNVSTNALKSGKDFSLHFNCNSHRMTDEELKDFIKFSLAKGWLKSELLHPLPNTTAKSLNYVGLTEKGGELWEQEREPIWDKFVSDSSYDFKGFWELSIKSPSLKTAKAFLKYIQKCNLYVLQNQNDFVINEIQKKKDDCLIPWKTFEKVYEINARLAEDEEDASSEEKNWDHYPQERSWWRFVDELQSLNKMS